MKNPNFKQFASVLARVTRRLLPPIVSGAPKEIGTSERMLRIAKQHVFAVTRGKTFDEIIHSCEATRRISHKPQGYVTKDDFVRQVVQATHPDPTPVTSSDEKKTKIERVRKAINFGGLR